MASPAQVDANRRNAQKSTGPKTEAGKAASRAKALKYGLAGEVVAIAVADAEDRSGMTIYFNSDRTGTMRIWRMTPDGTDQSPVTPGESNDWFPHPSPDGRSLAFLSYEKDVKGHPEDKDVTLRLMDLSTKKVIDLAHLFGGQGTINVPCWSPDGRQIAFVTYQRVP